MGLSAYEWALSRRLLKWKFEQSKFLESRIRPGTGLWGWRRGCGNRMANGGCDGGMSIEAAVSGIRTDRESQ